MEKRDIKYVAIYLRKSRGDQESDLEKHRQVLTEICKSNNLKYIEYREIESGESIEGRSVFRLLLNEVKRGLYDAVCVMDLDRLGRGDEEDQARIKKTLAKSDTLVITPHIIYDLNNDTDSFMVDMQGFIAHQEYKQIVKRLIQGKRIGARLGMWTNGRPPYPYEYQRWRNKYNEKGLVINDDKLKTYRFIVDSVINEQKTPSKIAHELNNFGVPSPRNGTWCSSTIIRLLVDETHLGKIISNKTVGDGHKKKLNSKGVKKIPRSKWIIVENCHESVKTIVEHEIIKSFISRITKVPKRATKIIRPLSGLVKCGLCEHSIMFYKDSKGCERLKSCWYVDPYGYRCPNKGMVTSKIYETVSEELLKYKSELAKEISEYGLNSYDVNFKNNIDLLEEQKKKIEKELSGLFDAFEDGRYSLPEFRERKEKKESTIDNLESQIQILSDDRKTYVSLIDKYSTIQTFEEQIRSENLSDEQMNRLYKSIIDCIIWTSHEELIIDIKFK